MLTRGSDPPIKSYNKRGRWLVQPKAEDMKEFSTVGTGKSKIKRRRGVELQKLGLLRSLDLSQRF